MRTTGGFLIVFLLTALAMCSTAAGNETDNSHVAHLTAANGPQITCGTSCHATIGMTTGGQFLDGNDLANTTVCNTCHSPGGAYNGVDGPNIGAKGNWVSGVYNGSALQDGKEKWCVGCHDDFPSVVNGVSAPNIAGNDYYGYYKTGHGKHGNGNGQVTCLDCHDPALTHVDGEARTYDCGEEPFVCAPAVDYRTSYRLKLVNGEAPLEIPRPLTATADRFRLCFKCHDDDPFIIWNNLNTNFRADVNDNCVPIVTPSDPSEYPPAGADQKYKFANKHYFHLHYPNKVYDSDFNGVSPDSPISCPACHNVHGPQLNAGATNAPGMIRTGELIGRLDEGALNLEYFTSQCPETTISSTNELFDATTGDSTGGSMIFTPFRTPGNNYTRNGVCGMCHQPVEPYWRKAKNTCGNCHNTGSHVAHLLAEYGPQIKSCDVCHDMNNFDTPLFSDGQNLDNTTVCNTCHSPGGFYDGVNDQYIGAKPNWAARVYEDDPNNPPDGIKLKDGKEEWCVTCHDNDPDPSVVNGVSAPNVAGDGTSYGYYKTGHGRHESRVTCLTCHDPALMHVDGDARTYEVDESDYMNPIIVNPYRESYRLKLVNGEAPMDIPREVRSTTADQFRLCFSCHDDDPFMIWNNLNTNFRADVNDNCVPIETPIGTGLPLPDAGPDQKYKFANKHFFHVAKTTRPIYDSDFDGLSPDSPISCPACHNVHGPRLNAGATNAPGMLRTGELIGRESQGALNLGYFTSQCPETTPSLTNELDDSTGGAMSVTYRPDNWTRDGVCGMCHLENEPYWRAVQEISMPVMP